MPHDDLDAVRAELAQVQAALDDAAEDDFERRTQLRDRQQELRARAAELRAELPADRETLEAELAELQRRREDLRPAPISGHQSEQGAGGGPGGAATEGFGTPDLSRAVDAQPQIQELDARIELLRRRLAELDER